MLTVGFLRNYRERPAHFANSAATVYAAAALIPFVCSLIIGLTTATGVLCLMTSLMFIGMGGTCIVAGLLSELMISQKHRALSPVLTEVRQEVETAPEGVQQEQSGARRSAEQLEAETSCLIINQGLEPSIASSRLTVRDHSESTHRSSYEKT